MSFLACTYGFYKKQQRAGKPCSPKQRTWSFPHSKPSWSSSASITRRFPFALVTFQCTTLFPIPGRKISNERKEKRHLHQVLVCPASLFGHRPHVPPLHTPSGLPAMHCSFPSSAAFLSPPALTLLCFLFLNIYQGNYSSLPPSSPVHWRCVAHMEFSHPPLTTGLLFHTAGPVSDMQPH